MSDGRLVLENSILSSPMPKLEFKSARTAYSSMKIQIIIKSCDYSELALTNSFEKKKNQMNRNDKKRKLKTSD